MYNIKFEHQLRQGEQDYECNSIKLTEDDYNSLPILEAKKIIDNNCTFKNEEFIEPIRHQSKSFKALWISNKNWNLESESKKFNGGYMDTTIYWVFVCVDEKLDKWIAFKFYDLATVEDCYSSTVAVSLPTHGDIYRLDNDCMEIVRKYFNN